METCYSKRSSKVKTRGINGLMIPDSDHELAYDEPYEQPQSKPSPPQEAAASYERSDYQYQHPCKKTNDQNTGYTPNEEPVAPTRPSLKERITTKEISKHKWYMGHMTRDNAVKLLLAKSAGKYIHPHGAFLVRNGESTPALFSISMTYLDDVLHFKILVDDSGKYFLWTRKFSSVTSLIEYYQTTSISEKYNMCLKDMKEIEANGDWKHKDEVEIQCFEYEEMIKIFRPLIVGNVLVREILPYITFIEDHDDIYHGIWRSPKEGMNALLDQILNSREVGKWQKFIEALSANGYEYIVRNIKGYRMIDHKYQKEYLKTLTPKVSKQINATELLPHLCAKDILGDNDKEEIEREYSNRGNIAAAVMLLDRIPRKHTHWYIRFIEALKDTGREDIAMDLEIPEIIHSANGTNDGSNPQHAPPARTTMLQSNKDNFDDAQYETNDDMLQISDDLYDFNYTYKTDLQIENDNNETKFQS